MAQRRNIRYGLNLDRGLYFEGTLSPKNAMTLGVFLIQAVQSTEHKTTSGLKLINLEGNIFGVDATKTRGASEKWRKLTAAPAVGHLLLTGFDRHIADIDRFSGRKDDFSLSGMGILDIPNLSLAARYRPLLPEGKYVTFTEPDAVIDDVFTVVTDEDHSLRFSISVEPPTTR